MCLQKSGLCCGGPAQIFCPQELICSDARCKSTQGVNFVVNTPRPHVMCYGSALSRGMFGPGLVSRSRNAQMAHHIFLDYFGVWYTNWAIRNWRPRLLSCGLFGMHETNSISKNLNYSLGSSLMELLVSWLSTNVPQQRRQLLSS